MKFSKLLTVDIDSFHNKDAFKYRKTRRGHDTNNNDPSKQNQFMNFLNLYNKHTYYNIMKKEKQESENEMNTIGGNYLTYFL